MNRGVVKVATYCLLGTLTIGSAGIVSHAETPMAGVTVAIDEAVQSNVIPNVTVNQAPVVNSEYDNLAIAQVNSYVNIRDAASEEGYIIGKIYNNSAGRILGEENGWYKVESGTVVGYVKGEFFATGEEAAELAKEVGTQYAEVNTTTLYVRNEPSTESSVVALLGDSEKLQVLEEVDGWLKVTIDGIEGYISKDFVTTTTKFTEAESKEEEETRIRKEEEARKAAEEAERQRIAAEEAARVAAEQVQETEAVVETETPETEAPETQAPETQAPETQAPETQAPETTPEAPVETQAPETQAPETQAPETQAPETQAPQTPQASSTGSRGQDIANFATQYVGGRYVWGGTNLATGVDCSGFTLSVLKNFGISIPRVAADQANAGTAVSIDNIQPGDLLFYSSSGYIDHVAIYIGNGQIVHASSSKTGIKYSNYNYRQPVKAVRYW